ncbi:MAG: beta-propeller domain-containing protein, partial [Myxococcota bacterium]|nr:beta-propeller domain-containing protein [Myxococcota bacterium]
MTRTPLLSMVALASLTTGCRAIDPDPELQPFTGCDEMSEYMAGMALDEARYSWALGFDMNVGFAQNEMALSGGDSSGGAGSYSTTNLQEAGVDEADLVKTDGTYLYSIAGTHLLISKGWPVEEAEEVARIEIDGKPDGLYLDEDLVVVVSLIEPWYGMSAAPRSGTDPERNESSTLVTLVDVGDASDPVVLRETYTSGSYETSRRIDDQLYVVTYQDLDITADADNLREARKTIRKAEASNWLPWRQDHVLVDADADAWDVQEGRACGCTEVYASPREGGTYLTNVLALDLSDPLSEFQGEAVVGRADTVYASPNAFYVAYSEWEEGPFATIDPTLDTVIHKFDISEAADHPAYLASAKIDGVLSDEFALSEQNDVLRVATSNPSSIDSAVFTLLEEDGEFQHLDRQGNIAPGEEIYAARFVGDLGYLVTYEVMLGDPLFTLDLSDPDNIVVAGELAVTGWSDYIQPMDEDHLLTVGMDEGDDGWRLAVSLFDVSDMEEPVLADRELVDAYGSEAQSEHHAFNYFADTQTLTIPSWTTEYDSVLEVLEATPEGLDWVGSVPQDTVLEDQEDTWCAPVRRSVIMEEMVWAVSAAGL